MALKGKAKEAVQEMTLDEIKADDGFEQMIEKLDAVFKTDDNQAAYMAYRDFETFARPADMTIQDFIIKFESLNNKIKKHQMTLPDGVLAYRFLHSANLKDEEMKLCRATIAEFKYKDMQQKVCSLYGDQVDKAVPVQPNVKEEPVFYGSHDGYTKESGYRGNRGDGGYRGGNNYGSYRGGNNSGDYNGGNNSGNYHGESNIRAYRGSNNSGGYRGGSNSGGYRGGSNRGTTSRQRGAGGDQQSSRGREY
jgi:hypothetical protein